MTCAASIVNVFQHSVAIKSTLCFIKKSITVLPPFWEGIYSINTGVQDGRRPSIYGYDNTFVSNDIFQLNILSDIFAEAKCSTVRHGLIS